MRRRAGPPRKTLGPRDRFQRFRRIQRFDEGRLIDGNRDFARRLERRSVEELAAGALFMLGVARRMIAGAIALRLAMGAKGDRGRGPKRRFEAEALRRRMSGKTAKIERGQHQSQQRRKRERMGGGASPAPRGEAAKNHSRGFAPAWMRQTARLQNRHHGPLRFYIDIDSMTHDAVFRKGSTNARWRRAVVRGIGFSHGRAHLAPCCDVSATEWRSAENCKSLARRRTKVLRHSPRLRPSRRVASIPREIWRIERACGGTE